MAIVQPAGHAHQTPVALLVRSESVKAKRTRRIKSVKVAAIN